MDPGSVQSQLEMCTAAGIAAAILALMSLIYLVAAVGDRDADGKIRITKFDRVFGEIQLVAISAIFFGGGGLF
jgi:hypothetical protein